MSDETPTSQAPGAPEPADNPPAAPTQQGAPPADPKPGDPAGDEFKSPESKQAVLADLAKSREETKALKEQMSEFQASNEARNKALAEALGLSEAPKSEDLAETVKSLQERFNASDREATKLRIAAEKNVPAEYHHLLTETDTEKLTAQAEMAAEYARLKAQAEGTPAFQANPGQGQGGQPSTPEAIAEAEYAQYYPSPNRK